MTLTVSWLRRLADSPRASTRRTCARRKRCYASWRPHRGEWSSIPQVDDRRGSRMISLRPAKIELLDTARSETRQDDHRDPPRPLVNLLEEPDAVLTWHHQVGDDDVGLLNCDQRVTGGRRSSRGRPGIAATA